MQSLPGPPKGGFKSLHRHPDPVDESDPDGPDDLYYRPRTSQKRGGGHMLHQAKSLRRAPTKSQERLWNHLRGHRLGGHKFRQEAPLWGYIADFYFEKRADWCRLQLCLNSFNSMVRRLNELFTRIEVQLGQKVFQAPFLRMKLPQSDGPP